MISMGLLSWDILSHYYKLLTLQENAINGFSKLYLQVQTGYHPMEQKYCWHFVS